MLTFENIFLQTVQILSLIFGILGCEWGSCSSLSLLLEDLRKRSYEQLSETHSLNTENDTGEHAEGKE